MSPSRAALLNNLNWYLILKRKKSRPWGRGLSPNRVLLEHISFWYWIL